MSNLYSYIRDAEALLEKNAWKSVHTRQQATALVNGGPKKAIRDIWPLEKLRNQGVFFTDHVLANKLLCGVPMSAMRGGILDPTCGAGDLLLAAASRLTVQESLRQTACEWGRTLAGWDVTNEFVQLARVRVVVSALMRGANHDWLTPDELNTVFPMVSAGNALATSMDYGKATCILLNPPYGEVIAPEHCTWATGRVTEAAIFAENAVKMAMPGTHLAMILPDVLRSGSRYSRWRKQIQRDADVEKVVLHGVFDGMADIDVFLLHLKKRQMPSKRRTRCSIMQASAMSQKTVGDMFDVHVGTVVPHRDKGSGDLRPYITARDLPKWCEHTENQSLKRTDGRGFTPPFVVVRRTSRPGDKHRAVATIIKGKEDVAVENHLLVLLPKDRKRKSCKHLLASLKQEKTTQWFDQRIRCRHLTVSAMRECPLEG
jgi:hypothetical protein